MIDDDILDELDRAVEKFPTWPTDPLHALGVVSEEYGELYKDVLQYIYEPHKTDFSNIRTEAIQLAAMAIRFCHSLDVYEFTPSKQHKQQ